MAFFTLVPSRSENGANFSNRPRPARFGTQPATEPPVSFLKIKIRNRTAPWAQKPPPHRQKLRNLITHFHHWKSDLEHETFTYHFCFDFYFKTNQILHRYFSIMHRFTWFLFDFLTLHFKKDEIFHVFGRCGVFILARPDRGFPIRNRHRPEIRIFKKFPPAPPDGAGRGRANPKIRNRSHL